MPQSSPDTLEAELADAILASLDRDAAEVRIAATRAGARALCRHSSGLTGCICRGDNSRCAAALLWGDLAGVMAHELEREGLLK